MAMANTPEGALIAVIADEVIHLRKYACGLLAHQTTFTAANIMNTINLMLIYRQIISFCILMFNSCTSACACRTQLLDFSYQAWEMLTCGKRLIISL